MAFWTKRKVKKRNLVLHTAIRAGYHREKQIWWRRVWPFNRRKSKMNTYAKRIIIAVIGFILFILVVPLLFDVIGIPIQGSALQLIKICAAIIALWYIIWGS